MGPEGIPLDRVPMDFRSICVQQTSVYAMGHSIDPMIPGLLSTADGHHQIRLIRYDPIQEHQTHNFLDALENHATC